MVTFIPADTLAALGDNLKNCDSRSVWLNRLAVPTAKDDAHEAPRKEWFIKMCAKSATPVSGQHNWQPKSTTKLYAQLKSRLMLNMAGGVMENAGLCLDRFGIPYIPGSAVKGCARRAAITTLREWCETGIRPTGQDNLLAPICSAFQEPSDLLVQVALLFGWVELDWTPKGDFAWACEKVMLTVRKSAATTLATKLGISISESNSDAPWKSLPNFTGSIAFLYAAPNADPGLELDVLTNHHAEYYKGTLKIATDTEDPVPVFFPAVKPQSGTAHFTFALLPLRNADPALLELGKRLLQVGLEVFGIGAKTNAGYGCFDASDSFNLTISNWTLEQQKKEIEAARKAESDALKEAQAAKDAKKREVVRAAAEALEKELANLSPEERADKKIELLEESQFDNKIRNFVKAKGGPSEEEKQAIVRALRGPRIAYWNNFKQKATKGESATIAEAIRLLSQKLELGKMP